MPQSIQSAVVQEGVGLGTVIAVVVSWHRNHSILWAIFHGVCSWIYVIYFALTEAKQDGAPRRVRVGVLEILALLVVLAFVAYFVVAQLAKG